MIAVASAQVVSFRHQLQLATLEFWRADMHHVLDGSQQLCVGTSGASFPSKAAHSSHGKASTDEKRRVLQQWLYESQCEDALSSSQMKSQQRCLEMAVKELEALRTVGICRRQTDKKHNCGETWGNSLLDVQWACQCAMLRHQQLFLQARQRVIAQGRELHDVRKCFDLCLTIVEWNACFKPFRTTQHSHPSRVLVYRPQITGCPACWRVFSCAPGSRIKQNRMKTGNFG